MPAFAGAVTCVRTMKVTFVCTLNIWTYDKHSVIAQHLSLRLLVLHFEILPLQLLFLMVLLQLRILQLVQILLLLLLSLRVHYCQK